MLTYGKEVILPPNMYLSALQLSQESQGKPCLLVQSRIDTLLKFEEERLKAKEIFVMHQNYINHWFNKKSTGTKNFEMGDLVLNWDNPVKRKENT